MRKLFDEAGAEIEVLDDNEVKELRDKAAKLEEDLKVHEGGKGVQNLREALNRRAAREAELEATKAELEAQLAELGSKVKEESVDPAKVKEMTAQAVQEQMVQVEVNRTLAQYDEDQRKVVKRYYSKLVNGEDVTVENVHNFLKEAVEFAFPGQRSNNVNVSHGGRPAQAESRGQGFGETDEGKNFAAQMGLTIEKPKK